jgi:PPK2 family polyphosphate:nucleotide phosphotransferase
MSKLKSPVKRTSYQVKPGSKVDLVDWPTDDTGPYENKESSEADLKYQRERIIALQERLWAEHRQSLLIVLQATDTGGKDGTIRHVFDGVNPQGCSVVSFKQPSPEELDHDFLWRIHAQTPGKGVITVFNRSHYEDVLVVRVHETVPEKIWKARFGQINAFEELLVANHTRVLKFFLHISRDEQRERLQSRLDDPEKRWKFNTSDLEDRKRWNDFQIAFAEAIEKCSTKDAPWHIIPSDHKWFRNVTIAKTVADTLEAMNPKFPEPENGLEHLVLPN